MTITVAGTGADFTSDITTIVKDLIYNNWSDSTAQINREDIVFGTDWWDGYGDFQIHFRNARDVEEPANIGWSYRQTHTFMECHVFVRANSEDRTDQLFRIKREIKRILIENGTSPGSGLAYVRIATGRDFADVTVPDHTATVWHLVATLETLYHMVKS